MRGQFSLSVGGCRDQRVALFGRSEACVTGPAQPLCLLDHVHALAPTQGVLGCLKRFDPHHGSGYPLDGSMSLLHDGVEVLHLADADGGAVCLVGAVDDGFIGGTAVHRDRFGEPVAADRLLQQPPRGLWVPVRGAQNVQGLAVWIHRPRQSAPVPLPLAVRCVYPPAHPPRTLAPREGLLDVAGDM